MKARPGRPKQPPPVVRLEIEYELASRTQREQAIALFAALCRNPEELDSVEGKEGKNGTIAEFNERI